MLSILLANVSNISKAGRRDTQDQKVSLEMKRLKLKLFIIWTWKMGKTIYKLLKASIKWNTCQIRLKKILKRSLFYKMRVALSSLKYQHCKWKRRNKKIWQAYWNNNTTSKWWKNSSTRNWWVSMNMTWIKTLCIKHCNNKTFRSQPKKLFTQVYQQLETEMCETILNLSFKLFLIVNPKYS